MFHDFKCFDQSCEQGGMCGSGKLVDHFEGVLSCLGDKQLDYFEHVEVTYVRNDLKKVKWIFGFL